VDFSKISALKSDKMKVDFVSIRGIRTTLEIDPSSVPFIVSQALSKATNTPSKQFIFVLQEKIIPQNTKFGELGLKDGSTVFYRVCNSNKKRVIPDIPIISKLHKISGLSLDSLKENRRVYRNYQNVIKNEISQSKKDPPKMKLLVNSVVQMGFSEEDAIKALRRNEYDPESAANELLGSSGSGYSSRLNERLSELLSIMGPMEREFLMRRFSFPESPSEQSPYFKHFHIDRLRCNCDSGYSVESERAARAECDRIKRLIEKDEADYNSAKSNLNRLKGNKPTPRNESHDISGRMRIIEERHRDAQESLNRDLKRAQERLNHVLEEKRAANIHDEEDSTIARPAPRHPTSPGQQRRNNELDELLMNISPEERSRLQSLVSDRVSFSEVVQLYLINDHNFEMTKAML
jgi:hypothetical protein